MAAALARRMGFGRGGMVVVPSMEDPSMGKFHRRCLTSRQGHAMPSCGHEAEGHQCDQKASEHEAVQVSQRVTCFVVKVPTAAPRSCSRGPWPGLSGKWPKSAPRSWSCEKDRACTIPFELKCLGMVYQDVRICGRMRAPRSAPRICLPRLHSVGDTIDRSWSRLNAVSESCLWCTSNKAGCRFDPAQCGRWASK